MIMELIIVVTVILFMAVLVIYNSIVSYRWHRENRGEEYIKEPSKWYNTFFYHNEDDPRLIVPKRTGGGYTFNFGKSLSWLLMGSGLVLVAAIILLA